MTGLFLRSDKSLAYLTVLDFMSKNSEFHCVVPENIHTPTTEGIGNSGGVGGGTKGQENPEERGGERINYFPEGQLRFIPM